MLYVFATLQQDDTEYWGQEVSVIYLDIQNAITTLLYFGNCSLDR